jgi:dTDP-glucose 4,6-dehydratase
MTDVSDATLRIALHGRPGETYHISTARMISIRALVEMILTNLGKDFAATVDIVGERPGKDTAYMLDSGKLRAELGWSDRIALEQGLEETIAWAARFKDDLLRLPWTYEHKP